MRSSELAWKHPRGALWVALKCGHTGSVYFQLRKQERWGGVSSRLKGQMSFRPAFSVPPRSPWALPLSPVILFFSPLFSLEGWEGRTLLNSEQMSWEEVVGWGWAHLRPWDGWRKYCRPDPEWLPYIYGCTLLFLKKKKKPSQQRFEVHTTVVSICRRKKRGSEKVRSFFKVHSDPAELEFEPDGFAFLITIPYGLKPQ